MSLFCGLNSSTGRVKENVNFSDAAYFCCLKIKHDVDCKSLL